MSKHSYALKLEVVRDYLKGLGGYRSISIHHGVTERDVAKWVKLYQQHGAQALRKRYQSHAPEFKLSVVNAMQKEGLSHKEAAAKFNIPSPSTISVWQRLYNEGGWIALQTKPKGRKPMAKPYKPFIPTNKPVNQMTPEELRQELEYRRVETDYLKKLEALAQQKILAKQNKSK